MNMPAVPTVALALSTKDRCELTRQILPGLDVGPEIHLHWFDGSETREGACLPSATHFVQSSLKEIHYGIRGGPDAAIQYALQRMLAKGYDYVGLIENDIRLEPGWVAALFKAIEEAERDGLAVGAVTVRTLACRCLLSRPSYAPMWNMGAGVVLFTKEGAKAILDDYHVTSSQQVGAFWRSQGFELHSWDLWRDQPDRSLGADWWYAAAMIKKGLVSIGSVPTLGRNIDYDAEAECRTTYLPRGVAALPGQQTNERVLYGKYSRPGVSDPGLVQSR